MLNIILYFLQTLELSLLDSNTTFRFEQIRLELVQVIQFHSKFVPLLLRIATEELSSSSFDRNSTSTVSLALSYERMLLYHYQSSACPPQVISSAPDTRVGTV
mmetsp:Transcript_20214/g.42337  ORF Transcript_20214/g.42337 Transcript_20214/m.42337 type:complete len:103 (-) Transcript_20214:530-838(-)